MENILPRQEVQGKLINSNKDGFLVICIHSLHVYIYMYSLVKIVCSHVKISQISQPLYTKTHTTSKILSILKIKMA